MRARLHSEFRTGSGLRGMGAAEQGRALARILSGVPDLSAVDFALGRWGIGLTLLSPDGPQDLGGRGRGAPAGYLVRVGGNFVVVRPAGGVVLPAAGLLAAAGARPGGLADYRGAYRTAFDELDKKIRDQMAAAVVPGSDPLRWLLVRGFPLADLAGIRGGFEEWLGSDAWLGMADGRSAGLGALEELAGYLEPAPVRVPPGVTDEQLARMLRARPDTLGMYWDHISAWHVMGYQHGRVSYAPSARSAGSAADVAAARAAFSTQMPGLTVITHPVATLSMHHINAGLEWLEAAVEAALAAVQGAAAYPLRGGARRGAGGG